MRDGLNAAEADYPAHPRAPSRAPVQPLRSYLRENTLAIAVIIGATGVWGFATGVLMARTLSIRLVSVNERPATALERLRFTGDPGALNALVLLALLLALAIPFRPRLRAGLYVASLVAVGVPAAILAARWLAPIMDGWRGPNLVEITTTPIGLAAAWLAWLIAGPLHARFRLHVRVTRRGRVGHSLCPECRYDLAATTTGVCPECGWTVPAGLRSAPAPPAARPR